MIKTLMATAWLNLKRDRVAQALTFALPVLFFSIFVMMFSNQASGTAKINVAVMDDDHSEL